MDYICVHVNKYRPLVFLLPCLKKSYNHYLYMHIRYRCAQRQTIGTQNNVEVVGSKTSKVPEQGNPNRLRSHMLDGEA